MLGNVKHRKSNLEGQIVFFSNISGQFDNRLHALNLPLNVHIEVFPYNFREVQEVN